MTKEELKDYLLDRKSKQLTSMPFHIKKILKEYTPMIPDDTPFNERKACFLNGYESIPKCKYSNRKCAFCHDGTFSNVSEEYYHFIKNDKNIKCEWLSWEKLFDAGLSLKAAHEKKKSDYYGEIRRYFPFPLPDHNLILERLLSDNFNKEFSIRLIDETNFSSIDLLNNFIENIKKAKRYKNNTIEHYFYRGHSQSDSVLLRKYHAQSGQIAIEKKRKEDPKYNEWYCSTRKHGLIANNKNSKMEKQIISELEFLGIQVDSKFTTKVDQYSEFAQITNRKFFVHDMYLPELNVIIEYNGIYWHQDEKFEIQKALYCSTINNSKYIIIWENDFNSVNEIIKYIIDSIGIVEQFSSSRINDILHFMRMKKKITKQRNWDLKFLEVAESLSKMSKCQSKNVCALAVKNNRIIGTGLNGSLLGTINCSEKFPDGINENNREEHHQWSLDNELHAEENLVAELLRAGNIGLCDATVYINLQPCKKCSLLLTGTGIKRIVYKNQYDKGDKDYSYSLFRNSNILLSNSDDYE